jgi:hypothetical protein
MALRFFTATCFITQRICFAGLPQQRCETGRRGRQAIVVHLGAGAEDGQGGAVYEGLRRPIF